MKLEISLSLKKKNKKKIVLPIFLFYSNHKKTNKQNLLLNWALSLVIKKYDLLYNWNHSYLFTSQKKRSSF